MMRSANKGITVGSTAQFEMSLDACGRYLAIGEMLEVKPDKMRIAKNSDLQVKRT
jgi:predicted membrane GTPase involved in stress response